MYVFGENTECDNRQRMNAVATPDTPMSQMAWMSHKPARTANHPTWVVGGLDNPRAPGFIQAHDRLEKRCILEFVEAGMTIRSFSSSKLARGNEWLMMTMTMTMMMMNKWTCG